MKCKPTKPGSLNPKPGLALPLLGLSGSLAVNWVNIDFSAAATAAAAADTPLWFVSHETVHVQNGLPRGSMLSQVVSDAKNAVFCKLLGHKK